MFMFTSHEARHHSHTYEQAHAHIHFTFIIILRYVQFQQVDRKCTIMKSMEDEISSNQTDWKRKLVYLSTYLCVCLCKRTRWYVSTHHTVSRQTAHIDQQLFHNICNSLILLSNHKMYARSPHSQTTTTTTTNMHIDTYKLVNHIQLSNSRSYLLAVV